MLRTMKARMALALAIALAPAGFSVQGLIENNAMANATYRPGMMAPHSKRAYTSGGELRVCNDGPVAVRLYINEFGLAAGARAVQPELGSYNDRGERLECSGECLGLWQPRRQDRSRPAVTNRVSRRLL